MSNETEGLAGEGGEGACVCVCVCSGQQCRVEPKGSGRQDIKIRSVLVSPPDVVGLDVVDFAAAVGSNTNAYIRWGEKMESGASVSRITGQLCGYANGRLTESKNV